MKTALTREHRKTLETVIAQARGVAESGAVKTLQVLAVGAKEAPDYFTKDQIKLRVRLRLRAHGRQLGDVFTGRSMYCSTDWRLAVLVCSSMHIVLKCEWVKLAVQLVLRGATPLHLKLPRNC